MKLNKINTSYKTKHNLSLHRQKCNILFPTKKHWIALTCVFTSLGSVRESSIAACKSSRTLLCECGGWEAAAPCSAQLFLSTMRGFLLTLLTLSVEKTSSFSPTFP